MLRRLAFQLEPADLGGHSLVLLFLQGIQTAVEPILRGLSRFPFFGVPTVIHLVQYTGPVKIHVSPRCVQLCFPTALHCSKCPLLCGCSGAELTARWGISRKLSLRITQHTDCWLQQGISVETHIKYTSQFVTERAKILLQAACCARKSYSLQGISHSYRLISYVSNWIWMHAT